MGKKEEKEEETNLLKVCRRLQVVAKLRTIYLPALRLWLEAKTQGLRLRLESKAQGLARGLKLRLECKAMLRHYM